jgi:hypothetical protein
VTCRFRIGFGDPITIWPIPHFSLLALQRGEQFAMSNVITTSAR